MTDNTVFKGNMNYRINDLQVVSFKDHPLNVIETVGVSFSNFLRHKWSNILNLYEPVIGWNLHKVQVQTSAYINF